MHRKYLIATCLLIAASAGCRICDSPYDYCSPVVDSAYDGASYEGTPHDGMHHEGGPEYYEEGPAVEQVPTPARKPTAAMQARR